MGFIDAVNDGNFSLSTRYLTLYLDTYPPPSTRLRLRSSLIRFHPSPQDTPLGSATGIAARGRLDAAQVQDGQ